MVRIAEEPSPSYWILMYLELYTQWFLLIILLAQLKLIIHFNRKGKGVTLSKINMIFFLHFLQECEGSKHVKFNL